MMISVLMRTVFTLATLAVMVIVAPAAAQEVAGDWVGVIEPAPGTRLPLVAHIERDDADALSGPMTLFSSRGGSIEPTGNTDGV